MAEAPQLVQLKTNYETLEQAEEQGRALKQTIERLGQLCRKEYTKLQE